MFGSAAFAGRAAPTVLSGRLDVETARYLAGRDVPAKRNENSLPRAKKENRVWGMKQEIRIASPCSADWDRMAGDERVRYCPECKLNVYNFSAMTAVEIERITAERDGRVCARFYQRRDGRMLAQNCPVGMRKAIVRASQMAGAMLTAALSVMPMRARATATLSRSSFPSNNTQSVDN